MKIQASTIVSFLTGRHYSSVAATTLYAELCQTVTGQKSIKTFQLPGVREAYSHTIMNQLPLDLQQIIKEWKHDDTWATKIGLIDDVFGEIDIQ